MTTDRGERRSGTRKNRGAAWSSLALASVIAVVIVTATLTSAWDRPGWRSTDSEEVVRAPSSNAIPTLFAADPSSRRAGVTSWMRRLRGEASPLSTALALPVPYDPDRTARYDSAMSFGGVDYTDMAGSGNPLQWLDEDTDQWLAPGIRLRDFVTRDGTPFVRIDPDLVARLERLRKRTGDLRIISGYRHPAYNLTVGGHHNSLHTAGRAADVWSPSRTALELARLALAEMGCDIGIGLHENTIHVDVRGELTSWTYEGAQMTEPAFDAWTLVQCGRTVPSWLSQAAAADWMSGDDDIPTSSERALQSMTPNLESARPTVEGLLSEHAATIVDVYRRGAAREPGGVVLDLRDGARVRYVSSASEEAGALGLPPLISWCSDRGGAYVAYAVLQPDTTITGVSNELGIGGHAPTRSVPLAPAVRAAPPAQGAAGGVSEDAERDGSAHAPAESQRTPYASRVSGPDYDGWVVFAGSYEGAAEAEAQASRLEALLMARVFVVAAPGIDRYRIAVGPYSSSTDAAEARAEFGDSVPDDSWVAPL